MLNLKWVWGMGAIALLMLIAWLGTCQFFSQPLPPLVQYPTSIPEAILPCLPRADRRELKALLRSGMTSYYAIGSYHPQGYRQILIALDRQHHCQNLIPANAPTPDNFLSAYISLELAQQIALQIYLRTIHQQGGPAQFQDQFQAAVSQLSTRNPGYLSPEQGWALKQLGIQIPAQIRIVTAEQYRQLLARRLPRPAQP